MFRNKSFLPIWRTTRLAALGCVVVVVPMRADDLAPIPLPPSPSLDVSTPILRPVPMPSGSPTPAVPAVTPSTPDASSSNPALTPPSTSPPTEAPATGTASPNAMVNLVNLLVGQHVITKEAGDGLIKQALQEATHAQVAQAPASSPAQAPAGPVVPTPAVPADDDTVQVTYVPDVVKNQIRDEVKADVMKQAQDEHWSSADTTPDWVHRFHVTGDIRVRYQGDDYPDGNANGQIVNFNAINTGAPFDTNIEQGSLKSGLIPTYNVDQNRDLFRLRARIGAGIDLGENFFAGMRLGTGSDDSPVTENQTLGAANGQGSNFSKYQIWLDRAFIRYEWGGDPKKDFTLSIGRFDNPFFSTGMIWEDNIGFDGFAATGKYEVAPGLTPFLTAGAFPLFNTDLNFGTNSTEAGNGYQSEDKWLYAVQGGATWIINKDFTFKGAAAYYDFENIQGQVSDPISQDEFAELGTNFNGDTDDSRPAFAQHGNTYIALRNVQLDPALAPGQPGVTAPTPTYQYFGLASPFREVALTGQLDYSHFDPFHIWLLGEVVNNLAFDRASIEGEGPPIMPGPQNNNDGTSFAGGGLGYDVRLSLGDPALEKLWDWNVSLTYRYVESDATPDAFTDSDFGGALSGTNLKGYIVGGNLSFSKRVWSSLRFLETEEIAGPPLKTDTVQVDINAKF